MPRFNSINVYQNRSKIKLFLPKKCKIFERKGLCPQTFVSASPPPLQISGYAPVCTVALWSSFFNDAPLDLVVVDFVSVLPNSVL